ncbi:MAG TPA: glycosyltransferase [Firmicutes bacterium]|nr:glycosyltransferase [Candidatus Fermentithermobacillaceae bacterium]
MSRLTSYYGLVREEILERIPYWITSMLDIGCGTGALGAALKKRNPACYVAGVDIFPPAVSEAKRVLDRVWLGDVEDLLRRGQIESPDGGFDVIVCADVLEHLVNPWETLKQLTRLLNSRGQIVISLPNFRNIVEISSLLSGSWSYAEAGIFDRTHLRFFTLDSAREMIENAGLEIYSTRFVADPRVRVARRELYLPEEIQLPGLRLSRKVSEREFHELTAYQMLFVAGPRENQRIPAELDVSIIIPHYNHPELISRCLQAIRKNSGPSSAYEIIVVDNGSTDGSREFLKKQQDVRCVFNGRNVGFTLAANQGAAAARGRYLVFLNNDTEVQEGWLDALVAAASAENVGAVGARLVHPGGELQEAGGVIFADGSRWSYGQGQDKDDPRFLYPRDVDYCSAAALLVKARAFWTAGGFDPSYAPAYYEDTDLCFSLRKHGWRVVYQPQAVVVRLGGETARKSLDQVMKSHEAANQAQTRFRSKWADELQQYYPVGGAFLESAAHRVPPLRILVVDQIPPLFDRDSEGQRMFQIMQLLKTEGHTVCLFTLFEHGFQEYVKTLQSTGVCVVSGAGNDVRDSTLQAVIENTKTRLAVLLASYQPHIVWAEGYQTAAVIAETVRSVAPNAHLITGAVDLRFPHEERMAEPQGTPETDAKELAIYKQSDAVITTTEKEKEILMQELPSKMIRVVPHVHVPDPTPNPFGERNGLLFAGDFRQPSHLDGMVWFLQDCWPAIVREIPGICLYIAGDPVPDALKEAVAGAMRCGGQIQIMGRVPTLRPLLNSARLSIAPLRFGVIKGKVEEALAAGLPVVATPTATQGMGLADRVNVWEAEGAQAFARRVVELYSDAAAWETLRKNGLEHAAQHYSPRTVTFQLRETLRPLVYGTNKNLGLFGSRDHARKESFVSIVIPCWNNVEYTRLCVDSIFRNTEEPFELILIDNGSTDGSAEYFESLQEQHNNVVVISNPLNTGYGYACNQGLAAATGDYVVIMNNDIVVPPNWLRLLLRPAQAPQVGIVGPRANNVSGSQCIATSYGSNLDLMEGFAQTLARKNAYQGSFVVRAVGFCMLVKRSVIEAIGGFDPRFGIGNFEDDDFCARAQLAGFKIWIADDAFVHHFGSVSFRNGGIDYTGLMRRNFELLKLKWRIAPESQIENGIPYEQMLAQSFSKDWHFCPFTPQHLAREDYSPVSLQEKRTYHFMIAPDWERVGERWAEAIRAFYEAFDASEDVGLLLRIDPLLFPDISSILERLRTWAAREKIDLDEQGRLILVVNDIVPPRGGAAVYRTAHAFIDTAPAGVFNRYAEEARACGLTVCRPNARDLRNALMSRQLV